MKTLCVTGYASIDYVMDLNGSLLPDQTSIGQRVEDAWPRVGGCPAYIAMAANKATVEVAPVTWVGDDAYGQKFITTLGVFATFDAFYRDMFSLEPAAEAKVTQTRHMLQKRGVLATDMETSALLTAAQALRGRETIIYTFQSPLHPAQLRCSSVV